MPLDALSTHWNPTLKQNRLTHNSSAMCDSVFPCNGILHAWLAIVCCHARQSQPVPVKLQSGLHLQLKWCMGMGGPLTPIFEGDIFWHPIHMYVLCMVSGSATEFFSSGKISAFFVKIFFFISVVILNSNSLYQIFEFDTNIIQILVWIIGSTYRKGEILKQIWHVKRQFFTVTRDTRGTRSYLARTLGCSLHGLCPVSRPALY